VHCGYLANHCGYWYVTMLPSIPVRAVVHTLGLSPSLRIGFPVLICALIPLRWNLLPRLFSVRELRIMDSLTADNEVVLATLGGKPRMPEAKGEEAESPASEDKYDDAEMGRPREALRQRVGSINR